MTGKGRHNKLPAEEARPIVLYVERFTPNPEIDKYLDSRALSTIDIEVDRIQAVQIIEHLRERNQADYVGSIRLRFVGRLIHL